MTPTSRTLEALTITLPLPPKQLHPNFRSRSHWPRTTALKTARTQAWAHARAALRGSTAPMWDRAITGAVFYFPVERRRDVDNLAASLKAYWDGIADAGIVRNDSGFAHVSPMVFLDKRNPRVELTVVEAPP